MSEHAAVPPSAEDAAGKSPRGEFVSASVQVRRRVSAYIDRVVVARREIARWQAEETAALAAAGELADEVCDPSLRAAEREMSLRSIAAALAASTRQSDRSVQRQIDEAMRVVRDLPATFAAFGAGEISRAHVMAVVDATANLFDDDARALIDDVAADLAQHESPGRLRAALRTAADEVDPRDLATRHHLARRERGVVVVGLPDAMAQVIATMPAVLAKGIEDRLTQQARIVQDHERAIRGPQNASGQNTSPSDANADPAGVDADSADEDQGRSGVHVCEQERTLAQIRADILADTLLTAGPAADPTAGDGPGLLGAVRGVVQVSVPVGVLVPPPSANEEPAPRPVAEVPGFGPVDSETAREMAANVPGWDIVSRAVRDGTDGRGGGEVLSVSRYRRSAEMERYLRARDEHCRFPGCRMPVHRCDLDHNIDAALGGATATDNLAHFCRRHHSLKQAAPAWTVRQRAGGVIEWTSPFGATYTDRPPGTVKFAPPPF